MENLTFSGMLTKFKTVRIICLCILIKLRSVRSLFLGREFYLENTNNLFQVYDNIFNQRSIGPTYSYKSIGIDLCLKASYNSGSLAGNSMLALKLSVGLYFDEFHDEAKPFYDFGFSSTF